MIDLEDVDNIGHLSLSWEELNSKHTSYRDKGLIGSCIIDVPMSRTNRKFFVYAMGRNSATGVAQWNSPIIQ